MVIKCWVSYSCLALMLALVKVQLLTCLRANCLQPEIGWVQASQLQFSSWILLHQGVVTYIYVACWSICDQDQNFWSAKSVLDRLISPSEALDSLIFLRVKVEIVAMHSWSLIFTVRRSPWSIDQLSKSALSAWFCFDPSCKHFYTGHISDYPLLHV